MAAGLPVTLGCPVRGYRLERPAIARGNRARCSIAADAAIVTLPGSLLAEQKIAFTPGLPAKAEAAAGLPLGLADKLFSSLSDAGEFEKDSRLFGRTDRSGTAYLSPQALRAAADRSLFCRDSSPPSWHGSARAAFLWILPLPNWSACSAAISPAG